MKYKICFHKSDAGRVTMDLLAEDGKPLARGIELPPQGIDELPRGGTCSAYFHLAELPRTGGIIGRAGAV
jgi:hypothetical protein